MINSNKHTRDIFVLFLLMALCLCFYANTLTYNFLLDDTALITENAYIKNTRSLGKAVTSELFSFGTGQNRHSYYRPLQTISHMADYFIWGLKPWGHRLSSILLHGLNGWLIYLLMVSLCGRFDIAFFSGALFIAHPIHNSAVANISGRSESLAALCILTSALALMRYIHRKKITFYCLSLACLSAALLAKESAIIAPLLLTAICASQRIKIRKALLPLAGFFIIDGFYIVNRFTIDTNLSLAIPAGAWHSPFFLFANAVHALREYCGLLVLPWPIYPMRTIAFVARPPILDGIFLTCILALCALLLRKETPENKGVLLFCFGWFALGFIPIIRAMFLSPRAGAAVFEQWLYVPSIGFFALTAFLLSRCKKTTALVVFAALLFFWGGLCIGQNRIWRDEETLYRNSLRHFPANTTFRLNLAHHYYQRGRYAEAMKEARALLDYETLQWDTALLMGNIFYKKNNFAAAKKFYGLTLKLNPRCCQAHNNLGLLYGIQREPEKAYAAFLKALEINPEYWVSYLNMGNLFLKHRLYAEAATSYARARELNPDDRTIASLLERAQGAMKKK